ncbi:MAG: phosphatidylcholine/phosphatidylserine synthase [Opitutales bacterium]|jgi:CDP-diacylglycerol--serine O-phosphatidyltransferase|nr:phosphatidylcholine/phosphatidylserine synthase [Opitutales bacterium]
MTAIKYALDSHWENALLAIIVAACFDVLDGATARLLKATSRFGAELDSLADAVNFGVIPSVIIYFWLKDTTGTDFDSYFLGWTWVACTLFTACCLLRLARFNIMDQSSDNRESANSFFVGVPSPAGAGIMLIPIVITLVGNRLSLPTKIDNTVMVLIATVWIAVVSILLISNIRTISFKKFRFKIRKKSATLILVFTILIITTLIKEFWVTIFVLQSVYVISLPICGLILKGDKVTD